jgi:hypothetical protein
MRTWQRIATLLGIALVGLTAPAHAQTLIWPGERIATIDAPHLRAYVPYDQREELQGLVARADQIWAQMCAETGHVPSSKLRLLISDWVDDHNGYAFVVPFPLVQVELAPARPESNIHNGDEETLRTLVHEFAHQISNDKNRSFRRVLESIFGRVLPIDLVSLMLWYLSTPAHQTMPRFWHEGLATWAETEYAEPESAWAGRGRDPLVHMVWRLDTAAGTVPPVDDWRRTYHHWPFGSVIYIYGVAYTRYLDAEFGEDTSIWDFVRRQGRGWPFIFNQGSKRLAGARHTTLIERARDALVEEQHHQLERLRAAPTTELKRLTPADTLVAAPAWDDDGALWYAANDVWDRSRLHVQRANGSIKAKGDTTRALGNMRRTEHGELVYHEFNWRRRSYIRVGRHRFGPRLIEPDARRTEGERGWLTAVRLAGAGRQELVLWNYDFERGERSDERVVETHGRPWSPALRPGHPNELAWVETDGTGSRLLLGRVDGTERRVLHPVRGRILHPVWDSSGERLFFCSDDTGVANAYCLELGAGGDAAELHSITNSIGGVIACVPSPDGSELAFVEHDTRGPFLARGSADPATWAAEVPRIRLLWAGDEDVDASVSSPFPEPDVPTELHTDAYRGLSEVRPLFWSPTTFASPYGGLGLYGAAADSLFTHVFQAGAGVGLVESELVGFVDWSYTGWPIELGLHVGRAERSYSEIVMDNLGREYDYTETKLMGEVRAGRTFDGLEHDVSIHGAVGVVGVDGVDDVEDEYAGQVLVSTPAFDGQERYSEVRLRWNNTTYYPTSFAPEDGFDVQGTYRHSGMGGDLDRNTALLDARYTASICKPGGHQIALRGQVGWSDGDNTLQSNFSVGGGLSSGLPRGYLGEAEVTGRYLEAASIAYRFPAWRPFKGFGTAPFRHRQLAAEVFVDGAKVSSDGLSGDGEWFKSAGFEVHSGWEAVDLLIQPGVGVALQLDGDEDLEAYFTLGFGF